jgi:hypothetical protein
MLNLIYKKRCKMKKEKLASPPCSYAGRTWFYAKEDKIMDLRPPALPRISSRPGQAIAIIPTKSLVAIFLVVFILEAILVLALNSFTLQIIKETAAINTSLKAGQADLQWQLEELKAKKIECRTIYLKK